MKFLVFSAAVLTVFLSACNKEPTTVAPLPTPSTSPAAKADASKPAAPSTGMTLEEKQKAMESAQGAAKAAGGRSE